MNVSSGPLSTKPEIAHVVYRVNCNFRLRYLFAKKGNFLDTSILPEVQQDARYWILDAG